MPLTHKKIIYSLIAMCMSIILCGKREFANVLKVVGL